MAHLGHVKKSGTPSPAPEEGVSQGERDGATK